MAPSEDVAQTNEADQGAREGMGAKVGDFLCVNLSPLVVGLVSSFHAWLETLRRLEHGNLQVAI